MFKNCTTAAATFAAPESISPYKSAQNQQRPKGLKLLMKLLLLKKQQLLKLFLLVKLENKRRFLLPFCLSTPSTKSKDPFLRRRKEDPPPNFSSPQNSKDFQVPSSPIGSLSSQRTHYQKQQQQQLWLLFQSATICNKLLPASSEKAEYKRQHDLSSHGQLWSCQQKTTNMQFELQ
ncbi:unnamed protein product [Sphagnum jensenii]